MTNDYNLANGVMKADRFFDDNFRLFNKSCSFDKNGQVTCEMLNRFEAYGLKFNYNAFESFML